MVRVMVKDGKRIFLEIGDDICRYYPNKKECREFRLQDIAVVERMEIALDSEVILRNAGGKILASFLMSMKNGSAAMRFFRDCNQGKLIDEYGELLPQFEIIVTKKPETEEQKERSEENRRTKKI